MDYKSDRVELHKTSFLVVLITVVLCSCILIGSVVAWLTREYTYSDNDNSIGLVDVRLFADGVEVTGTTTTDAHGKTIWSCNTPYAITGTTALREDIGLTIRNMGTIDALVRATINIYYIDDYDNQATDTDKRPLLLVSSTPSVSGTAQIDTTYWIHQFPAESVACGYMFYDDQVSPYILREKDESDDVIETIIPANEIDIINQILLSESQKNTTIYIDVTIDAVAYDGNIYKKIEEKATPTVDDIPVHALPFGYKENLPTNWDAWR